MEMVSQRKIKLLRAYAICKYIRAIRTRYPEQAQPWPGLSKLDTDCTSLFYRLKLRDFQKFDSAATGPYTRVALLTRGQFR